MPTTPTKQSEHVAAKVRWLLSLNGNTPALLAIACGVKSQSVYDWRDFGRVAKRHIPVLARLSNTTEKWWLSPESPIPPTASWLGGEDPMRQSTPASDAAHPTPEPAAPTTPASPDLQASLPVVLSALAKLTAGQWRMVRARLDDLPEQPGSVSAVLGDVAPILGASPRPWDGVERRSGEDRRQADTPPPPQQTPQKFAA